MGPEQLKSVMESVGKVDESLKGRIERESEVLFGTARLWDDGVILPKESRNYLGEGLRTVLGGRYEPQPTTFGVFRM